MDTIKFTKGDAVKVCLCHKGVREALLANGWAEDKSTSKAKPAEAKPVEKATESPKATEKAVPAQPAKESKE